MNSRVTLNVSGKCCLLVLLVRLDLNNKNTDVQGYLQEFFYINSVFFFTTLNLHNMRLQRWDSIKSYFLMLEKLHDANMFCIL